jgi:hypothetical protein
MSAVAPVLDTGGTYYEITIPGNILWMMTTMTNVTTPNLSSTYKVINNINMTGFTLPNTLESICKTTVAFVCLMLKRPIILAYLVLLVMDLLLVKVLVT